MQKELSYWVALAHLPKINTKKKNDIIVTLFQNQLSIIDLFKSDNIDLKGIYGLNEKEVEIITNAKKELSNYAFLVEDLLDQGYKILTITSPDYSPILKKNLGKRYTPPVMYAKGNLQLLQENSVAIVGSRKANATSLEFTDNIAKKVTAENKIVVSGFAKGVDRQALNSAIHHKGQSIIVLPQGITTFKSGYKKYYKQIISGNVLVVSTFYPKAPWSVQFAMARNPIIYGLASEIYVAQSSDKGGTWSGVIDGLRKDRKIYVRKPSPREKNANNLLIEKGAIPVDMNGILFTKDEDQKKAKAVAEPDVDTIEEQIIELVKTGTYSSREIVDKLQIEWTARKVTSYLKKQDDIQTIEKKPLQFRHINKGDNFQTTLF